MTVTEHLEQLWLTATPKTARAHANAAEALEPLLDPEDREGQGYLEGLALLVAATR